MFKCQNIYKSLSNFSSVITNDKIRCYKGFSSLWKWFFLFTLPTDTLNKEMTGYFFAGIFEPHLQVVGVKYNFLYIRFKNTTKVSFLCTVVHVLPSASAMLFGQTQKAHLCIGFLKDKKRTSSNLRSKHKDHFIINLVFTYLFYSILRNSSFCVWCFFISDIYVIN